MSVDPFSSVTQVKGVGPKLADTLARLGIHRLIDLLLHLPYRYQDRTQLTPLANIQSGQASLIEGQVMACQLLYGRRRSLKVAVADGTGVVYLRFFHFSKFQQNQLANGKFIRAYGEFRFFGKDLTCAHPEYEVFTDEPDEASFELTPIYPTTQGLGQARIRRIVAETCKLNWSLAPGTPFADLIFLHQPPSDATPEEIERRQEALSFDELCTFYLVMKGRAQKRKQNNASPLPQGQGKGRELLQNLGFTLTDAQSRVIKEVLHDLENSTPMLRLVQGDVGSGKTVVAAFAAIRAAEQQRQTAVMAPTELLAEQHFINFSNWLTPLGINTVLLSGGLPAAERRERLALIENGSAHVVIGTHALFQDSVTFNNLALSIIDEQHRFGVHQRMFLQSKAAHNRHPHQLVMTATPIPRTLTMALYADMDVSVIDELPKGRQPIVTHTVEERRRSELIGQIRNTLDRGQQAYWVCTLIEDSDEINAHSALSIYQTVSQALPKFHIGLLHGRMKSAEKVATMQSFKQGDIQLLVATTVIEVGVDVPNATDMVIENTERLGLAQLHQLRGRVGRGHLASHCYLMFPKGLGEAAKTRLTAMRDSQDGFYLAEQDLKLRGPGDILGTRQSGEQSFRIADLTRHGHLLPEAMRKGDALMQAPVESEDHTAMLNLLKIWAPADSGPLTV